MSKVFFTYVWGPPGNPAWPLTFSSKGARTQAIKVLTAGDVVYLVGTNTDPTEPVYKGRVLSAFRVSDLEVNTADYAYLQPVVIKDDHESIARFPFALHPIAAWEVTSAENRFAALVGSLTPAHHLKAQTTVVELDPISADPLLALELRPLKVAEPQSELTRALIKKMMSKLAPKHSGTYTGQFKDHEIWYVYALDLKDRNGKTLAVKVGYAHDPKARAAAYDHGMAREVTGLRWELTATQGTTSEDAARQVEQEVFAKFVSHRLASNGEILTGVTSDQVLSAAVSCMAQMKLATPPAA